MKRLEKINVGFFFKRFIREFEYYEESEFGHIFQFNNVKLTGEFLLLSHLSNKTYSCVSFLLDEPEVVVFENKDGEEQRAFSSLIECSLKI